MGEIKQTNFRIDQETATLFRNFCDEQGFNQAQGFDHIMQVVEMDRAKAVAPERLTEIESFEKSVKEIMAAYLTSIEINKNAELRIREQFASALSSKDKTINDLQLKNTELNEEKEESERIAESAAQAAAQAIKDGEAAKEQAETVLKLAEEKDKTIATLAEKLSAAEEKAAGYDDLKKNAENSQDLILDLRIRIENAKSDGERKLESLKKDHATELRELKAEMERKLSDAEKDAALELAKSVADKEREIMEIVRETEKENARLQAKIEVLAAKIND